MSGRGFPVQPKFGGVQVPLSAPRMPLPSRLTGNPDTPFMENGVLVKRQSWPLIGPTITWPGFTMFDTFISFPMECNCIEVDCISATVPAQDPITNDQLLVYNNPDAFGLSLLKSVPTVSPMSTQAGERDFDYLAIIQSLRINVQVQARYIPGQYVQAAAQMSRLNLQKSFLFAVRGRVFSSIRLAASFPYLVYDGADFPPGYKVRAWYDENVVPQRSI